MIPAGYMLKQVLPRPSWIKNEGVVDIVAVSPCFSKDFADYIDYWRHNGYWLFNNPSDMDDIVVRQGVDRSALSLFYFEVYEREFDEYEKSWSAFSADQAFETNVIKPSHATLKGFDVVSYALAQNPEHSPLSCNSLADEITVNSHCLFDSFDDAKNALEAGKFDDSEPGPYRIFAVYAVDEQICG
ncbi:MAG: hypothetical protein K2X34_09115 [Hyphomonadaceae bacterium]|nr:hypothetical protein [Hyphomonadaceae bacterium]